MYLSYLLCISIDFYWFNFRVYSLFQSGISTYPVGKPKFSKLWLSLWTSTERHGSEMEGTQYKRNICCMEFYACFEYETKTGVVRILVIFQNMPIFSHIIQKVSARAFHWRGWTHVYLHSKSETVKIHYFPYKIAPLVSFSGAILFGETVNFHWIPASFTVSDLECWKITKLRTKPVLVSRPKKQVYSIP